MIPTHPFGRTGHQSTRAIFGAFALAFIDQEAANATLELMASSGVNHIDTAATYGDAEERLGPWLSGRRGDFFLATKTEARTRDEARAELERSLERMQTSYVDLWQMHCLVEADEWEMAMGPDGVLEAFIAARDEGLARYLGVTGHGVLAPCMHLKSLERFDFDAVLLPYNYSMMANLSYAADFEALLEVCAERDVAVQTIKALARGPWQADAPRRYATWYQPLDDMAAIRTAVHWTLNRPGLFLNTVGDPTLLPHVLEAAATFTPQPQPTLDTAMAALRTEPLFR